MPNELLQQQFLNNSVLQYLIFFGTLVLGIIAIKILQAIIMSRVRKWARKTATEVDDFLVRSVTKTLLPLLYFGIFYVAIKGLTLHATVGRVVDVLIIVILTLTGVRLLAVVVEFFLKDYWLKKKPDESKERNIKAILPLIRIVIWGLGIVFLLDNLDLKISAVIAGLGIGGIAVALAAQAVLGDLFSYFSILFDRPFEVGDFIIVGDFLGTVEHVGIKTTRLRSLSGEQLIFSNQDLTNSRVRNYKRMEKRRVVFRLGVTYQTTLEQLKEVPEIIKEIIQSVEETAFDRAHFFSYGDFSLIFEVVYYVLVSDYNKYMDLQQVINFAIKEEFEKRSIEFAYPTQTLYVSRSEES